MSYLNKFQDIIYYYQIEENYATTEYLQKRLLSNTPPTQKTKALIPLLRLSYWLAALYLDEFVDSFGAQEINYGSKHIFITLVEVSYQLSDLEFRHQ